MICLDGAPRFLVLLKEDRVYPPAINIGILVAQMIKAVADAPRSAGRLVA